MLTKLQELVTELYLAETGKKQERLWQRVRAAMVNLKIKPALMEHIIASGSPAVLAKNVQNWIKASDHSR